MPVQVSLMPPVLGGSGASFPTIPESGKTMVEQLPEVQKNRLHPYLSIISRRWVQLVTLVFHHFVSSEDLFTKWCKFIMVCIIVKNTPKKNMLGIQVTVVPKRHARKMRKESLHFGVRKNCRSATCLPLEGPGERHVQQAAITTLKFLKQYVHLQLHCDF